MTDIVESTPTAEQIDAFLTQLNEERFDDPVWVDAEFYAVIAANFDTNPPEPPQPPTAIRARGHQSRGAEQPKSRQGPAGQVLAGDQQGRQRSPPPKQ